MAHLDRLMRDMERTLKAATLDIKKGDRAGAAWLLIGFADDVSRYGNDADLLLEDD